MKAQAILDAARDGARVINCSWRVVEGTRRDASCVWCKAVDTAVQLGSVVVKSAGNAGPARGTTTCPGNAMNVIAVGAVSDDGRCMARNNFNAEFSSHGPTADGRMKPEVVAPGENIQGAKAGGGYTGDEYADGTSFAAPHVAGLAALLLQQHSSLGPLDIRRAIMETAVKLDGVPEEVQGAGLIDCVAALRRAAELAGQPPAPPAAAPAARRSSLSYSCYRDNAGSDRWRTGPSPTARSDGCETHSEATDFRAMEAPLSVITRGKPKPLYS